MRRNSRILTVLTMSAVAAAAIAATTQVTAFAPKFFNDDPLWREPETQDASAVKAQDVNLFVDLAANVIRGMRTPGGSRARNLNTIDEVPDSSWFTNRAGFRLLTPADVTRGPNTTNGPVPGTWTIASSKSDGITPGFTVVDPAGQRWFLKFDPRGYRGMATGTEVTVTKLLWALGYNVPENHIAYAHREQFVVGSSAKFTPVGGKPRAMRSSDVDELLKRVDREPDGSYRLVASKALDGKPVGRIRFIGTRPDDPNDVVPHEDRRELRAYGVFAAWLNHVDAKAINSLDTLVAENGRSVVRHHLIDFGSALGSGGVAPADYWGGNEYLVEPGEIGKQIIGLGFYIPKWHTRPYYESRSVGRLPEENRSFNPDLWKPRVPNQAFLHARQDDKFWAARRLAALTTDLLRAAVAAGQFDDPKSEEFLVRALAERRDAVLRAYLAGINPVSDLALDTDGRLTFTNPAVDADVARIPFEYRAVWSRFDNLTQVTEQIGTTSGRTTELQAPESIPRVDGTYVRVDLSAVTTAYPTWSVPVETYFRHVDGQWRLIGLERLP